ncbi:MAG TPA: phytanoyl-CoA dioxygenase family protein [Burkholderiales bacterium]|jgi:phytanoyl-CoA hydroxylase|nr:phytanoyl-CoA dioxygenase family protein [Burkholderiales bacterium]
MSEHSFSQTELDRFARDGFIIVRALADRQLCGRMKLLAQQHLAQQIQPVEYEAQTRYPGSPASLDAPGGRTVRRLLQAFARDPLFGDLATSRAIGNRLRPLLGPQIELSQAHHNCVMTKNPAFSSATSWHQDIRYWSFEKPELISAWVALGQEHQENGCLLLVPGSHRIDFRREQFDDALFLREDLEQNGEILKGRIAAELDEGDVLFFHCRLLHSAGRNRTDLTKFAAVFTYHNKRNRALPGTRSSSLPEIPLTA